MKKVILLSSAVVLVIVAVLGGVVFSGIFGDRTERTEVTDKTDRGLIEVTVPVEKAEVSGPLVVEGQARGNWYFEASFPVKIVDANGVELGSVAAQAQGDWMTDDFVPFKATLTFDASTTETGELVLMKDNPSGLPENDDELRVPIRFVQIVQNERSIKLYYYNAANDKDASGNVMCSSKGLVAVDRTIASTVTPIQDAVNLLLQGKLSADELARGITTEYPLVGLSLKGAALSDGKLKLEFIDAQNKTSGGSCRASILWAQIEATVKQFAEVKSVSFMPEEVFQP